MRDLKSLAGCKDVAGLRSTIHELCTGLVEISHFDVLTLSRPGRHQALCFFRLESAVQERQLIASLGASRFGSELLLVVDLPAEQSNIVERDSDHDQTDREDVVHGAGHDQNAGDTRSWFKPAHWSGTLLVTARRVLDREIGWPGKRLVP